MNKNNPKIRSRSLECILIGYSEDLEAYRLYHHSSHHIIVSFHVDFIESHDASPHVLRPGTIVDNPSVLSKPTITLSEVAESPVPSASIEAPVPIEPRRSARLAETSASLISEESGKKDHKSAKRQRQCL